MKNNDFYVILPYLRTTKRVRFPGVEFRSSSDLDGLPEEARQHLSTLCSIFYVRDGVRIKEMACAHVEAGYGQEQAIREAHQLVAYLYTTRQRRGPSLSYEQASLFLFRADKVPSLLLDGAEEEDRVERPGGRLRPTDFVAGYEGIRNWQSTLWADGSSRIYPEVLRLHLTAWENLHNDLEQFLRVDARWAFGDYWFGQPAPGNEEVRRRVSTALEWHGRSCRDGISSAEAIANLAIALESLLKVPEGPDLTRRFAEAVMTLLGPVPRLDSWLHQFYDARSKTVHEGAPRADMFHAADKADLGKANRQGPAIAPLLDYGHDVFGLCLTSVLSSAVLVSRARLAPSFVSNQERLVEIRKGLKDEAATPSERIANVRRAVEHLTIPWFPRTEGEPEFEAVQSAAKTLALVYEQTSPPVSTHVVKALRQVTEDKGAQDQEWFESITQLKALLEGTTLQECDRAPAETLCAFLKYAGAPHFRLTTLWSKE